MFVFVGVNARFYHLFFLGSIIAFSNLKAKAVLANEGENGTEQKSNRSRGRLREREKEKILGEMRLFDCRSCCCLWRITELLHYSLAVHLNLQICCESRISESSAHNWIVLSYKWSHMVRRWNFWYNYNTKSVLLHQRFDCETANWSRKPKRNAWNAWCAFNHFIWNTQPHQFNFIFNASLNRVRWPFYGRYETNWRKIYRNFPPSPRENSKSKIITVATSKLCLLWSSDSFIDFLISFYRFPHAWEKRWEKYMLNTMDHICVVDKMPCMTFSIGHHSSTIVWNSETIQRTYYN